MYKIQVQSSGIEDLYFMWNLKRKTLKSVLAHEHQCLIDIILFKQSSFKVELVPGKQTKVVITPIANVVCSSDIEQFHDTQRLLGLVDMFPSTVILESRAPIYVERLNNINYCELQPLFVFNEYGEPKWCMILATAEERAVHATGELESIYVGYDSMLVDDLVASLNLLHKNITVVESIIKGGVIIMKLDNKSDL